MPKLKLDIGTLCADHCCGHMLQACSWCPTLVLELGGCWLAHFAGPAPLLTVHLQSQPWPRGHTGRPPFCTLPAGGAASLATGWPDSALGLGAVSGLLACSLACLMSGVWAVGPPCVSSWERVQSWPLQGDPGAAELQGEFLWLFIVTLWLLPAPGDFLIAL